MAFLLGGNAFLFCLESMSLAIALVFACGLFLDIDLTYPLYYDKIIYNRGYITFLMKESKENDENFPKNY